MRDTNLWSWVVLGLIYFRVLHDCMVGAGEVWRQGAVADDRARKPRRGHRLHPRLHPGAAVSTHTPHLSML